MMNYADFILKKRRLANEAGFRVSSGSLPSQLFPFQTALVQWALRKGRAAIFADCGL